MAARKPNEDLFEPSRMSFGQHLEELRKVLIRSVIGLGIACIFGFWLASDVVEFLKDPLEQAIQKYNTSRAASELKERDGFLSPELSPWLDEGIAPRQVMFDPAVMRKKLGMESVDLNPYGIDASQIKEDSVIELAQRFSNQAGAATEAAKFKAMWDLLTANDQAAVTRVAGLTTASESDVEAIASVLDRLTEVQALSDDPAFKKRLSIEDQGFLSFLSEPKENPLADMKAKFVESSDSTLGQRINRVLITEAFDDQMQSIRLDLVSMEIWETTDTQPVALTATEPFLIWVKAGLIFSLTLSAPWIFYQIWSFVAAGLYPHEQKYIYIFMPFSLLLFVAGACLAYFYVFGPVLSFLFSFNSMMGISIEPRINDWVSFVMLLPLGFGIAFQLPLVMLFMNRIGLFSVEDYLTKWRIAVMIIFVLSMLLTPADPISMILLAGPLTCLYFLGIGLCKWMPKAQNPYSDVIDVA